MTADYDRRHGAGGMIFGLPAFDARGTPRGVFFASIDGRWLQSMVAGVHPPPGWLAVALDRDGRILARYPDVERLAGQVRAAADLPRLIRAARGRGQIEMAGMDGVLRRFDYAPLPGTGDAVFEQTFELMGLLDPAGRLAEVNDVALALARTRRDEVLGKPFWDTPWWRHDALLRERVRAAVQRVAANRAFCELTGYAADEAIGMSPSRLNSGHQDSAFYAQMWRSINEDGSWAGEIWARRKDGHVYPAWLSIGAVRDASGRVSNYIGISTDLTAHKRAEERIRQLAYHDVLTGLPNLKLLEETAMRALAVAGREGHESALLFIDVDHLKHVNESLGHAVGDVLLVALAQRMRAVLRDADTLARILQESGVDPALLELELTEGMVMEDSDNTLATLDRLKALGVRLSVDDFGTGYSNLGYLKRFPVDKLKIDQSFVRDIAGDSDGPVIARAVVSMGHSLRLKVIAEGVETEQQAHILRGLGCDDAQGYHFGRPMPAADAARLLGADSVTA